MTFHGTKRLTLIACALALGALAGCQGSGGLNAATLDPDTPQLLEGPAQLPDFPAADAGGGEPRIVAQTDNIQDGRNTWSRSTEGAVDDVNDLVLSSDPPPIAWGIWRWGVFTGATVPETLRFEADPDGESVYWVLLSDYATGQWEVFGPADDSLYAYSYESAADYISTAGYTYVAVLVEGGNGTEVGRLNLRANEDVNPPAAPVDLTLMQTRATSVDLAWTPNGEPDLDGYYVYTGPTEDFGVGDPGVEQAAEVDGTLTEYTVGGLEPETEYHFRLSAFDDLGNESPLSNTVTATTLELGDYAPPSDLTVVNIAGSWVELSYTEPADPSPLGYEFYTGPTPGFELGQPGVVQRHIGLITDNPWRMEGLEAETEYHCRARALYLGSNYSELSDPVTFETIIGTAPSPDFFTIPAFVQVGQVTTFDPSTTTDDDTPLANLTFTWDFENDGTPDAETTGPDQVTHTYPDRGEVECKLTVSDGTAVSIVRDITVSFRFDYEQTVASRGDFGTTVAVDVNPGDDRIAALVDVGGLKLVQYYDGASWESIGTEEISGGTMSDVALSPTGVAVLIASEGSGSIAWTIHQYAGGSWTTGKTSSIAADGYVGSAMDLDSNGRAAVIMYTGRIAAGPSLDIYTGVWHEKTDGTFNSDNKFIFNNQYLPLDIQRSTTTTYAVYCHPGGSIHQWSFTDSSDSDQNMQSFSGTVTHITTGTDPSDNSRVFWAAATDGSRVYYGDNYGSANGGSQYYTASAAPTGALGVGLAGDNEGLFYWSSGGMNDLQTLYGYDTTAGGGSGQLYVIASGYGAAAGGAGAFRSEGATDGVYAVATESRDGECTGRFLEGGTVHHTDTVYEPDEAMNIGIDHVAITFGDGGILSLASQNFPTARSAYATAAGQSFTLGDVGLDTFCKPQSGCATSTANEFFVASYTESSQLLLNRFTLGTPEGTLEGDFAGTGKARLAYNETTSTPLVCYTTNSGQNIAVRTWNGSAWSGETQIYSGASSIEALTVTDDPDGEWGVAFIDAAENTKLVETSGAVWGSAVTLSTETVFGFGGIGLDYHADGHMCVAVERGDAPSGVYLGVRPDGGSLSWVLVDSQPDGNDTRSIYAFYHLDAPVVLYYYVVNPNQNSRMQLVESDGGDWVATELPFHMHCHTAGGATPVAATLDTDGNIVLAGYRRSGDPQYAAVAILYN